MKSSDGFLTHDGTKGKLMKTLNDISVVEARVWLFQQLFKNRLATRDIYFFALKQAGLRMENTKPDPLTVRYAMLAKQRDIRATLDKLRIKKKSLEAALFSEVGEKTYKFRKTLRKLKDEAVITKNKKLEEFKRKISHYQSNQQRIESDFLPLTQTQKTPDYSNKASTLNDFNDLSIFKGPSQMPSPEPPLGPFICDEGIILSSNEKLLLSKIPKFSVRGKIKKTDVKIETERMLAKHRYTKSIFKKKGVPKKSPENIYMESGNRLDTLTRLWTENRERLIYDEISGSVDFSTMRPTDYRHNKSVKLPKPIDSDGEFGCELRRRKILTTFDQFDKMHMKAELDDNNIDHCLESNLTKKEQQGLRSLKKRIKKNELVIGQTDKSSRFCVLNRDQYLESGKVHTAQDEEINWTVVKSLQNQVNSTTWWLAKILNISKETDDQRMMRNLQNHSSEVAELYLLFKDHKSWNQQSGEAIPSRPVVSGNQTYNVHLSEILSEVLEPVAKEMHGAEIASTEDALCQISDINDWIHNGKDIDEINGLNLEKNKYNFREEKKFWNLTISRPQVLTTFLALHKLTTWPTFLI